jgi:nucleotide-binding universal stress UspA family protein
MFKNILVATDGSDLAEKVMSHALGLAKIHAAKITAITVTEAWSAVEIAHDVRAGQKDPVGHYEGQAAKAAKSILDKAAKSAQLQGVACEILHVHDQHPAEGIVATASNIGADLIVIGSHGRRGLSRLLLGSQTYEVVTNCKVPVLVIR